MPIKQKMLRARDRIGRASPRQGEDPGSIPGPGNFSPYLYLITNTSTKFSQVDMVGEK